MYGNPGYYGEEPEAKNNPQQHAIGKAQSALWEVLTDLYNLRGTSGARDGTLQRMENVAIEEGKTEKLADLVCRMEQALDEDTDFDITYASQLKNEAQELFLMLHAPRVSGLDEPLQSKAEFQELLAKFQILLRKRWTNDRRERAALPSMHQSAKRELTYVEGSQHALHESILALVTELRGIAVLIPESVADLSSDITNLVSIQSQEGEVAGEIEINPTIFDELQQTLESLTLSLSAQESQTTKDSQ